VTFEQILDLLLLPDLTPPGFPGQRLLRGCRQKHWQAGDKQTAADLRDNCATSYDEWSPEVTGKRHWCCYQPQHQWSVQVASRTWSAAESGLTTSQTSSRTHSARRQYTASWSSLGRILHIRIKLCHVTAHPVYGVLSWKMLNSIQLQYNPCRLSLIVLSGRNECFFHNSGQNQCAYPVRDGQAELASVAG